MAVLQQSPIPKELHPFIIALAEAVVRRDRAYDTYKESAEAVRELMVMARDAGVTQSDIARATGVSRQRVFQILEEAAAP